MRLKFILPLFTGFAMSAGAQTNQPYYPAPMPSAQVQPVDMYVVMFRADWCGPCKIVEPRLDQALNQLADSGIEHVTIDSSDPPRSKNSAHLAFDRDFVQQYNSWWGVTGFAAMIDADTKQTLGCVDLTYDAASMAMHIRNLKEFAMSNQQTFDVTCPAPNN
ncbi:MAG: hypothetical protein HKN36_06745 [Hellea sp.]|nr:hypothetical protein [Hellea sp.]